MKQFTVLVLLLLVGIVNAYAYNSNKNSTSEFSRKRFLINFLHALRTLRDHKKVKSTRIAFPKLDDVHSGKKSHIESVSINHVLPITKTVDDIQTARIQNQNSKRSRGIHKESKGGRNNPEQKIRNSKELFLQLLQTLKGLKTVKNEKLGQRPYSSKNQLKHATRTTQKIEDNFPSSLSQPHNRNKVPDFDRQSRPLKPVTKIAKIGRSQTNKARYSFSKARLSFLQALETAQDEKLTKLGNLEKKFSYILPKGAESTSQNVAAKNVNYALQDFAKDQSATALSHIPDRKLVYKPIENATPMKHSLVGKPLRQIQHKVAQRYKNKKRVHGLLPSMVDELLWISNAPNKLEKLKRLRILRAKLLNSKLSEKNTRKQVNTKKLHDEQKTSYTGKAAGIPLPRNAPYQKLTGVNEMRNDIKTSRKLVYDNASKRQQGAQIDGKGNLPFQRNSSISNVNDRNEYALKAVEYKDAFKDFVDPTNDTKKPTHSILNYSNNSSSSSQLHSDSIPGNYSPNANETLQNAQDKMANIKVGGIPTAANKNEYGNQDIMSSPGKIISNSGQENLLNNNHSSQYAATWNGNTPITSLNGITSSGAMEDNINKTHTTGRISLAERQNSKYLDNLGHATANHINIVDKTSNENQTGLEKDQSYLPLDSSRTESQTKNEDFKNPLSSVVSEHDKIISELTSSKTLAKQLSNGKSENSHKTLSKVLQQAQDIFLKKVKEILAGEKTKGKDKINSNQDDNKSQENSSQKPTGGVINTSAYVMDESPPNAKATAKVVQDNSGIVPKTPTNDDLANSLNRQMPALPLQPPMKTPGIDKPMQSMQTPMDPSPPFIGQPGQGQQGHPVSGQPLTYAQLQDAREEERVALQQENAFRTMQNGVNAPLNGENAPTTTNSATPFQSYVGSNLLPQANHYSVHNSFDHAPNIDDLSEYRGGMERYQLSHHFGYDGDTRSEDDYVPRHHFHSYRHRIADDDDDENYDDDDNGDDDFDEDGEKKSKIGKPRLHRIHKHSKHFKTTLNSSRTDHMSLEKVHSNHTFNH